MSDLKSLMLRPPRLTLAVAESLTSGRLQARIGAISGASNFFRGGITAYTLESKVRHLGVDRAAAASVDCVSAAVAEQMAQGACALFDADLGAATTGYAEPTADGSVKEPFAWWALARRRPDGRFDLRSARIDCPGASRTETQDRVTEAALSAVVEWLRSLRAPID